MTQPNPIRACEALGSAASEAELVKTIVDVALDFSDATRASVWTGDPSFSDATSGDEPLSVPSDTASAAFEAAEPTTHDGTTFHRLTWAGEPYGLLALARPDGRAVDTSALLDLLPSAGLALKNLSGYTMLEQLVQQEMTTIVERELEMQLVLDSMKDGLLVCDLEGRPTEIRSAAVERWLGKVTDGDKLWDYLAAGDLALSTKLSTGFEQLAEDFLPFELSAEQMPDHFERDERIYELDYQPMHKDGALAAIVVIVADATERILAKRSEAEKRELVAIIQGLVQNRPGFMAFADEMAQLLDELARSFHPKITKRLLHTIKGNSSIFNFHSFAEHCHQIEDAIEEGARNVDEQLSALNERWGTELSRVEQFITGANDDSLRVGRHEVDDLLDALTKQGLEELRARVYDWKHDPIEVLLAPQMSKAEQLAARCGKSVKTTLEHRGLRLPSHRMRPFVSNLTHVMRNAVDHGLETSAERAAAGKSETGTLHVDVTRTPDQFVLVVEDDGRGIDWELVARVAERKSMPHDTRDDLVEALFADGVSTKETVSEVSGRGVGMASLRAVCHRLGGSIRVTSERGRGTRFEFEFGNMDKVLSTFPSTPCPCMAET